MYPYIPSTLGNHTTVPVALTLSPWRPPHFLTRAYGDGRGIKLHPLLRVVFSGACRKSSRRHRRRRNPFCSFESTSTSPITHDRTLFIATSARGGHSKYTKLLVLSRSNNLWSHFVCVGVTTKTGNCFAAAAQTVEGWPRSPTSFL